MKIVYLISISNLILSSAVQAQSIQEWENCTNKIGRSLNTLEIGNIGYEQELKKHCGVRPATHITQDKLANSIAYDLIQANQWKVKFQQLLKKDYIAVQSALSVSGTMQNNGNWWVGSGYNPQGAGVDQAAIAINTKTHQVLAVYVKAGVLQTYGFDENTQDVPEKLWQWMSGKTAAG